MTHYFNLSLEQSLNGGLCARTSPTNCVELARSTEIVSRGKRVEVSFELRSCLWAGLFLNINLISAWHLNNSALYNLQIDI